VRLSGHTLRRTAQGGYTKRAWNFHSLDGDNVRMKPAIRYDSTYSAISGTADYLGVHNGVLVVCVGGNIYYGGTLRGTYTGSISVNDIDSRLVYSAGATGQLYYIDLSSFVVDKLGCEVPSVGSVSGTAGSGGSMEEGAYYYYFVWRDIYGVRSQASDPVLATVTAGNDQITLLSLPAKPTATGKYDVLEIYRTAVDGSASGYGGQPYYLDETTAAFYIDRKSDLELGSPLETSPTWPATYRMIPAGTKLTRWNDRLAWINGNKVYWTAVDSAGLPTWETYTYRIIGDSSTCSNLASVGGVLFVFKQTEVYSVSPDDPNAVQLVAPVGTIATGLTVGPNAIYFWYRSNIYELSPNGLRCLTDEIAPMGSEVHSGTWMPLSVFMDDRNHLWVVGQANAVPDFEVKLTGAHPYPYIAYVCDLRETTWCRFLNCEYLYAGYAWGTGVLYLLNDKGRVMTLSWAETGEQVPLTNAQYITTATYVSAVRVTLPVPNTPFVVGTWVWWHDNATGMLTLTRVSALHGANDIEVEAATFAATGGTLIIGYAFGQWDADLHDGAFTEVLVQRYNGWIESALSAYLSVGVWQKLPVFASYSSDARTADAAAYHYYKEVNARILEMTLWTHAFACGNPTWERWLIDAQPTR